MSKRETRTVEALVHELAAALGTRCRWVFMAREPGDFDVSVFSSLRPAEIPEFLRSFGSAPRKRGSQPSAKVAIR